MANCVVEMFLQRTFTLQTVLINAFSDYIQSPPKKPHPLHKQYSRSIPPDFGGEDETSIDVIPDSVGAWRETNNH